MSGPLLLLAIGGILSAVAFLVRSRPNAAYAIGAVGAVLLAGLTLGVVLGAPIQLLGFGVKLEPEWTILGRTLGLGAENRQPIGFVFLTGAVLLVAGLASGAPRRLPSAGLGVLLAVAAAMMVRPFVFAPALIAGAAIAVSVVLRRDDGRVGRAAPRLLASYIVAMMVLLLAGWLIEVGGVSGASGPPTRQASILLGLGLAIVIIVPPFHTWLTAAGDESHPVAFAFAAIILQTAGLILLLKSLDAYAWMRADPVVSELLRGAGLLMILLGAIWGLAERRGGRLVAYALIVDFGVSLLACSKASEPGYAVALGMAATRALSVVVVCTAIAVLSRPDGAADTASANLTRPAVLAAVVGGMSLAGFPLTAGFPGRWMTISLLVPDDLFGGLAVVAAIGAVGLSFVRRAHEQRPAARAADGKGGRGTRVLLWAGSALLILLGLAPGAVYGWAANAVTAFQGLTIAGPP